MEKRLTLISISSLTKEGDGDRYLLSYSISIEGDKRRNQFSKTEKKTIIVSISRTLLNEWIRNDNRYSYDEIVTLELMRFGLLNLREYVQSGNNIENGKEFSLTTYDKYVPQGINGERISPGYQERIEVKGRFGFL